MEVTILILVVIQNTVAAFYRNGSNLVGQEYVQNIANIINRYDEIVGPREKRQTRTGKNVHNGNK